MRLTSHSPFREEYWLSNEHDNHATDHPKKKKRKKIKKPQGITMDEQIARVFYAISQRDKSEKLWVISLSVRAP
ncbi:hypothetical protein ACFLTP_08455 [Chloroflexota bacterium]